MRYIILVPTLHTLKIPDQRFDILDVSRNAVYGINMIISVSHYFLVRSFIIYSELNNLSFETKYYWIHNQRTRESR